MKSNRVTNYSSMPTPPTHTQQVPMPVCRYEVLNGSPEGAPVFYATIGQMASFTTACLCWIRLFWSNSVCFRSITSGHVKVKQRINSV